MKKMLLIEYASMKKVLLQQCVLAVVVTIFVAVFTGLNYMIIPMIGVMLPMTSIMTQAAYDERNGWEAYRMTLPLSRRQVVVGRYVFTLAVTLVGIALGTVLYGALHLVAPLLTGVPAIHDFAQNFVESDLAIVALTGLAALFMILLIASVIFPFTFKFGVTKAVRWLPLMFVALVFGIGTILEYTDPQITISALSIFDTREGALTAMAVIGIVCAALFAGSSVISNRLYTKREF